MKKIVTGLLFLNLICVIYLLLNVETVKGIARSVVSGTDGVFSGLTTVYAQEANPYREVLNGKIEVFIPVEKVLQLPELPNGCEITSLTSILNFNGYNVSKLDLADNYLPKEPFKTVNNVLYGPDPNKAYAGNPRQWSGFFSYAPPIVKAAQAYIDEVGAKLEPIDLSGSSREEIMMELEEGNPVVIWVTLDLSKKKVNYSWNINNTNTEFNAPTNLHSVVLNGYIGNKVHVMDPLQGQITYDADAFFASYEDLGSHAMTVK
ncbi:C39 family peptidase [Bacillus sp. 1P02SD]|uniref:C39 family peptidase n=1 Tax=Bacillus sp. 1P02SD TaxID=3132264 RepID=UPI0039A027D5